MAAVVELPACAATVRVIGQLRAPCTSALRRAVMARARTSVRRLLDAVGLLRVLEDTATRASTVEAADEGSRGRDAIERDT
jgi:hypothetical protein